MKVVDREDKEGPDVVSRDIADHGCERRGTNAPSADPLTSNALGNRCVAFLELIYRILEFNRAVIEAINLHSRLRSSFVKPEAPLKHVYHWCAFVSHSARE